MQDTVRKFCLLTILVSLGPLTGCVTRDVGLKYATNATATPASVTAPAVSAGSFVDQRGEEPTWLGAIRGGYGNPIKTLDATPSVSSVVQTAFSDGLQARGFKTSGNAKAYQVNGVIKKFDCSQYVRREAHAEIEVSVYDTAGGKALFTRTYTADNLEGSLLAVNTGVFASVDTLRALAEKTLDQVVDKALDDSALRSAMQP
jgi:uncharacterized lipoprotein YajG